MSEYRVVCRHVRFWRGANHRWSTVYPFTGSLAAGNYAAVIAAIKAMEQAVLYPGSTGTGGGLYEIALYNSATGGVPVAVTTYFDPTATGSWVAYAGTAWPSLTVSLEPVAEVAMEATWLAGLSSSGKPVRYRKWFHSVPSSVAASGAVDISAAARTTLQTALTNGLATVAGLGISLGRNGRLAASSPVVNQYYQNHQMPRGRRRKVTGVTKAAADYSAILGIINGEAKE